LVRSAAAAAEARVNLIMKQRQLRAAKERTMKCSSERNDSEQRLKKPEATAHAKWAEKEKDYQMMCVCRIHTDEPWQE